MRLVKNYDDPELDFIMNADPTHGFSDREILDRIQRYVADERNPIHYRRLALSKIDDFTGEPLPFPSEEDVYEYLRQTESLL